MGDEWEWELADSASDRIARLDDEAHERVTSKLNEVVADPWRDPEDYLEPLHGIPHQKLRVGQFRLGCRLDRDAQCLYVLHIKKRGGGAYRDDD